MSGKKKQASGKGASDGRLNIVYMPIDDIIPYKNNARRNEDAVPVVKASIEQFGFRVPVCVDRDNVLVYGHTRLLGARGVMVVCEGVHFCMTSRGVRKKDASMVTSAIRGTFAEDAAMRNEFLQLIAP